MSSHAGRRPGASDLGVLLRSALAGTAEGEILVSRLASPALRSALQTLDARAAPAVRGRTIWPPEPTVTAVAEWPGWLGRLEAIPPGPTVWITTPEARPAAPGRLLVVNRDGAARVVDSRWRPSVQSRTDFEHRTALAKRLGARARQRRAITTPWTPESPTLVLLLPVDPGPILAGTPPPSGVTVGPLSNFPEFPGGLRIELRTGVDASNLRSWIDDLGAATRRGSD